MRPSVCVRVCVLFRQPTYRREDSGQQCLNAGMCWEEQLSPRKFFLVLCNPKLIVLSVLKHFLNSCAMHILYSGTTG